MNIIKIPVRTRNYILEFQVTRLHHPWLHFYKVSDWNIWLCKTLTSGHRKYELLFHLQVDVVEWTPK